MLPTQINQHATSENSSCYHSIISDISNTWGLQIVRQEKQSFALFESIRLGYEVINLSHVLALMIHVGVLWEREGDRWGGVGRVALCMICT